MKHYRQTYTDLNKAQGPSFMSEAAAGVCFVVCILVMLFI